MNNNNYLMGAGIIGFAGLLYLLSKEGKAIEPLITYSCSIPSSVEEGIDINVSVNIHASENNQSIISKVIEVKYDEKVKTQEVSLEPGETKDVIIPLTFDDGIRIGEYNIVVSLN